MTMEIPQYSMKAYALFYSKYGDKGRFKQSELDWIVGQSMKKKIFALLLKSGWIRKKSDNTYVCIKPNIIINSLLEFRAPELIKSAKKEYAFTRLSAIEIWSDYSYVQRSKEKSPYFIKILEKDLDYWKEFFNKNNIPNYIDRGSTIGEYIILIPVKKLNFVEKDGYKVESLRNTMKLSESDEIYNYAHDYMRNKHG